MTRREIRISLPPGLSKDHCIGVKDAVSSLLGLWDIPDSSLDMIEEEPDAVEPD